MESGKTTGTIKQIQSRGKYKKGWQKGVWKYYDQQGHLAQKQTHHKDKTIDIVYYYPNGKIESYGKARIKLDEKENIHFFGTINGFFIMPMAL